MNAPDDHYGPADLPTFNVFTDTEAPKERKAEPPAKRKRQLSFAPKFDKKGRHKLLAKKLRMAAAQSPMHLATA